MNTTLSPYEKMQERAKIDGKNQALYKQRRQLDEERKRREEHLIGLNQEADQLKIELRAIETTDRGIEEQLRQLAKDRLALDKTPE